MKMNVYHAVTLILLIAKLAGYFPYSWLLVFLPSIISIGIGCLLMLLAFIASVVAAL